MQSISAQMRRDLEMSMWYDWQPKPEVDFHSLAEFCPVGQYRVATPEEIPSGILPQGLLAKTHDILVLCSGTPNGRTYFMLNANRIDRNDVDQMPYAIAFDETQSVPSGLLIQHGSYTGRTTPLPKDFHEYVAASGIYPIKEMPSNRSGLTTELKIGSQEEAFKLLVNRISVVFPEDGDSEK
jgi:hypothetical protein